MHTPGFTQTPHPLIQGTHLVINHGLGVNPCLLQIPWLPCAICVESKIDTWEVVVRQGANAQQLMEQPGTGVGCMHVWVHTLQMGVVAAGEGCV